MTGSLTRRLFGVYLEVAITALIFGDTRFAAAQELNRRVAYTGVNIAGAAFGGGVLPGKHGTNYFYPKTTEIDYFANKGMNIIRVPFRWERMQRRPGANLDESELKLLDSVVDYATSKDINVLLDLHNYAMYLGAVVGTRDLPIESLAEFWGLLADHYKKNPRVFLGLMNEPKGLSTEIWLQAANASIAEIRRRGFDNLIFVPGNFWTSARSWLGGSYGTPNSKAMLNIVDPKENYLFEVHQYFDHGFAGTHAECQNATIGRATLAGFTSWARENHKRGFLGEFGVGPNQNCLALLGDVLKFMEENSDVWAGWTYWAAGPWPKNYFTSLEPYDGMDRPQMTILERHLQAGRQSNR